MDSTSDSEITIDWSNAGTTTEYMIMRYVVDVREYSSTGPGKTKTQSITGYPHEIPATRIEHTVELLSELYIYSSSVFDMFS